MLSDEIWLTFLPLLPNLRLDFCFFDNG